MIETQTPLPGRTTYVTPWYPILRECTVTATAFSDAVSAINQFILQESSNLTHHSYFHDVTFTTAQPNKRALISGKVVQKYWRIVYANGSETQTKFELETGINVKEQAAPRIPKYTFKVGKWSIECHKS